MASFAYDTPTIGTLSRLISSPRLTPYLVEANGDAAAALDLYVWNIRAGAAFYGPLSILEIVFRNACHEQLSALFTSSWHNNADFIKMATDAATATPRNAPAGGALYRPTDLLTEVVATTQRIERELAKKAGANLMAGLRTSATTDDVVAALDFGFWTQLFNTDLEPVLYSRGLYRAFPNWSPGRNAPRGPVAGRFNSIRLFRNRIMHFEPLLKRDLVQDLNNIIEACEWIDPSAAAWVEYHSVLEEVLRDRNGPRHSF